MRQARASLIVSLFTFAVGYAGCTNDYDTFESNGVVGGAAGGGTGGADAGPDASAGKGGAAGASGSAGSGGVAGKGGAAGNAGTGGVAGNAGTAGTAGTAGSAGTAGAAGDAGSAGTAGAAGDAGSAGAAGSGGSMDGGSDAAVVCTEPGGQVWTGNGHCYFALQGADAGWTNQRDACVGVGAYLVTITSDAEQTFVQGMVGNTDRWIGLSRQANQPWGEWVTGETFDYTHWGGGEPNEAANVGTCARIRTSQTWADRPCNNNYGAICERE